MTRTSTMRLPIAVHLAPGYEQQPLYYYVSYGGYYPVQHFCE
ncbi:hypothetical protein GCM10017667_68570 [Streptomyces filamentosus]|uniref:Uncharacterized protein n=1 Tax=Streptomyces filamentosus TaxID=67294 RepID=A0A919BWQ6_STRFL|nr:hypothetical protein GCM10017667_68570 [Streptomyces filamentosus]